MISTSEGTAMRDLFIDFENVHKSGLEGIDNYCVIVIMIAEV